MKAFLNAVKAQAIMAMGQGSFKVGLVTSVKTDDYAVKVQIQPEGTETGWLPVATMYVGNGFSAFFPPQPGNLVGIVFERNDPNCGYVVCQFFNDEDRPQNVPVGEGWLFHKSGSYLKFRNNGDIEIHATNDISSSASQWNHSGNISVTGGDVVVDGISVKHHTHPGVTIGTSNTGQPQ